MDPNIVNQIMQFLPIVALFVAFYFFLIRPQQKQQKKLKEMLSALKVGDRVRSIGGIFGRITSIKDDVIVLEVGQDKLKIPFQRSAIGSVEDGDVDNTLD